MLRLIFKFLLIISLAISSFAKDEVYFLPKDSQKIQKEIKRLFKNSKNNIDIAMYNFSYKKFIKYMKKAHKKGVNINLILDGNKAKKNKINFIEFKKTRDKKLHIKMAIFDDKTVVFGSANWKEESFKKNYEVIYVSDDKKLVKKFSEIFKSL